MAWCEVPKGEPPLKSHFLRFLLRLYGYLSTPLYSLKRPLTPFCFSSLSWLWNLTFACLAYYWLFLRASAFERQVQLDPRLVAVFKEKVLFAMLFTVGLKCLSQILYLGSAVYYLSLSCSATEPSLINLLDSFRVPLFERQFHSMCLFLGAFLVHLFFFLLYQIPTLPTSSVSLLSWLPMLWHCLVHYSWSLQSDLPYFLILYFKYATVVSLENLLQFRRISLRLLEEKVRRLACTSHQLGRFLSWPLFLSLVDVTFHLILTCSCAFIHPVSPHYYTPLLLKVSLLLVVAYFERRIVGQLRRLSIILEKSVERALFTKREASQGKVASRESVQIHAKVLIPMYAPYFGTSVFGLVSLTYGNLAIIGLFILEYVVLVSQTNI